MDEPAPRIIDGYRLTRFLGCGGFGEVWLCRSEAMADFRAIKLISSSRPDRLEREYASLVNYRAAASLRSPHLVPIEHINWYEDGLCYVMPLADGSGGDGPEDPDWKPLGLDLLIETRREREKWFTSGEIVAMLRPVLLALQTLSDAKLVHRDVKPANILFFDGSPRLGDVSLLGEDAITVTRRGTPGYAAPSWYEGGHPDMYSVGATLYALLTGNPPDKMGRAAFLWPPQGEGSLSRQEREEWKRLHAVLRRVTDERVSERYVDFDAMLAAVEGEEGLPAPSPRRKQLLTGAVLALGVAATGAPVGAWIGRQGEGPSFPVTEPTAIPELTPDQEQYNLSLISTNLKQGNFEVVVEFAEELFALHPRMMENPQLSLDRATALKELGRIDEAKEELGRLIHVHPNMAWMQPRIRLWESMGEIEEAEAIQTLILEAYGPATMALSFRAEIRAKRGNYVGVEADREAALPLNPESPNNQKRLVALLWSELEDKYPGYREYRAGLASADTDGESLEAQGGSDAEEEPHDEGQWVLAFTGVIAEDLAPEGTFWAGRTNEGANYLRSILTRFFEEESYRTSLDLLDERTTAGPPGTPPPVAKTFLLSLYRALLLERLGREEEAERELTILQNPPYGTLGPMQGGAGAAVLVALGRKKEAEELLTGMMEVLPAKESETVLESRSFLHAARAKTRAFRKNYPGVHDDYEAAQALVSRHMRLPRPPGQEGTNDFATSMEGVWERLREQFPTYAAYEKSLSESLR